jgi:hypothetical protein
LSVIRRTIEADAIVSSIFDMINRKSKNNRMASIVEEEDELSHSKPTPVKGKKSNNIGIDFLEILSPWAKSSSNAELKDSSRGKPSLLEPISIGS